MSEFSKFILTDGQIPAAWINVLPSLKEPLAPPLNPETKQPLAPQDLAAIFPMTLIEQEFSPQPEIDIPGEVLDIYRLWRPTPLFRATGWKSRWIPPRTSTTSTKAPVQREAISQTRR